MARDPLLAASERVRARKPCASAAPAALVAPASALDGEAIIRSVQLAMDKRERVATAAAAFSALAFPNTYVLSVLDPKFFLEASDCLAPVIDSFLFLPDDPLETYPASASAPLAVSASAPFDAFASADL